MPYKTGIRLIGVARNPANGFPARLLGLSMADVFNKAKRSEIMRGIRSTDTRPEMRVRKKLHGLGFRYRLHDKNLPGKPDIVR